MKGSFIAGAIALAINPINSFANDADWNSHILSAPLPQNKVIPSAEPVGTWAFSLTTKISSQDQDWTGKEINDVTVDFKPRLFGYYEFTDKLRFTGDIWMRYRNDVDVFSPKRNVSDTEGGYTGSWEHLLLGLEHEDFGAIAYGAHATIFGATVMDMHNALGMIDLQGNPKTGNKFFYINDFGPDNDLFIRGVYNYGEKEWGATIGYQNFISYANSAPFPTYGIYLNVTNEKYMSQSADFGGGNLHNTDNDLVYALSGYYGNGKGTYFAAYLAYGDDDGVDFMDQPLGFLPSGNPHGQGTSFSVLARHKFDNGFVPTVSMGTGGDGEYAIVDLAYQFNKHLRSYIVTKFATDDEPQTVVGLRADL